MTQLTPKNLISPSSSSSPKYIVDTLNYIKAHKIEVFIDIVYQGKTVSQARAYCIDFNKNIVRFFIRFSNEIIVPENAEASAFFFVVENGKKIPCSYVAPIIKIFEHKEHTFIDTALPGNIGHTQRRNCVRIPINKNEIPNLKLWIEGSEGNTPQALQWIAVQDSQYEIVDISAGGILFIIDTNIPIAKKIEENTKVLCTGIFPFPKKSPLCISMLATVRRFSPSNTIGWNAMGIRFIRWAYLENYSTWNTIPDDNGIPPLVNWVFQVMANRKKAQG